jgi:hypothetical protein
VVTPRPTAPPAGDTTSSQTFGSTGGSAGIRCTGDSAALQFATPQAGYATEVHDGGPAKIDVRFDNRERESRIVVTCTAGTPRAEIRED